MSFAEFIKSYEAVIVMKGLNEEEDKPKKHEGHVFSINYISFLRHDTAAFCDYMLCLGSLCMKIPI